MGNPHQRAGRDDYLHYYAKSCIFMIRGQVLSNCQKTYIENSFPINIKKKNGDISASINRILPSVQSHYQFFSTLFDLLSL